MRATIAIVAAAWSSLGLLGLASAAGYHVNTTSSMPQGIWRERPFTGAVHRGDAVVVCLPATEQTRRYIGPGPCANGLEPLLKTVGAVAGDVVTLGSSGVVVNGVGLPNTATMKVDRAGRSLAPYPYGAHLVEANQLYLLSSHDIYSYDSRYFGPVETATIIAIGAPIITTK